MRNKIKFVIFGSILSLSLLPIVTSAGVTLATDKQAQVNWFWINATGCSVTTTFPVPPGNLSPQPSCGPNAADSQGMIQSNLNVTPGTYWFTINGTDDTGVAISATDWLEITQAKPTTVPVLSINPGSGYSDASFTLTWTTSNNNPINYCITAVGPGINVNDNPSCGLYQGTNTSFTFGGATSLAALGLNTPGIFSFTIYACNTSGCSGNSNPVTYTSTGHSPSPVVKVNLGFLDNIKSSLQNILAEIKNINLIDKTFAYTTK